MVLYLLIKINLFRFYTFSTKQQYECIDYSTYLNRFFYRTENITRCCTGNCSDFENVTSCTIPLDGVPRPGVYNDAIFEYEVSCIIVLENKDNIFY